MRLTYLRKFFFFFGVEGELKEGRKERKEKKRRDEKERERERRMFGKDWTGM